jgi:cellulose synthase (UDP-forming)
MTSDARTTDARVGECRVRNALVFSARNYVAFAALTALSVAALLQFFSYWLSLDHWVRYPATSVAVTALLAAFVLSDQLRWLLLPLMRRPLHMAASPGWSVGVATTFLPEAESVEMLEETVRRLVAMDYPHDTWVLDEGDDARVRSLCDRLGARHFSRKGIPRYRAADGAFRAGTKHGNYNAWLSEVGHARYDIVVAFDPDHVPDRNYLLRVLGYFSDPQVGYVQAAQVYYNQRASFIARGAAEETYAYYSSMQMASYAMGYPIITGCHNAHRAVALKEVGGFAAHDADDLLLTQLYRAAGWRGVYVPEVLAKGITPVDWDGYLTQQWRWARSVLDIKFRLYPGLSRRMPAPTRLISFLHGLNYVQEGLLPFVGAALLAYMLLTGTTPVLTGLFGLEMALVIAAQQLGYFYRQSFYLNRRDEWGLHWRAAVLKLAKWPYVLAALFEVAIRRRVPYVVTPKLARDTRGIGLLWPHLAIALALAAAWGLGRICGHEMHASIHVWTALMLAGAVTLTVTAFQRFPPPYEEALRRAAFGEESLLERSRARR